MKKRLIRAENTEAIESVIRETAQQGRELLQAMEKLRFQVDQCTRITPEGSEAHDKVSQNVDMLDKLQSALFSICYDLENFQITPVYNNEQINMSDQDSPDSENEGYDLNEAFPAELPEEPEEPEPEDEETDDEDFNLDEDIDGFPEEP